MSVRRLVAEVDPATVNVSEFCRQHGISTWFFYNLQRRFHAEGDAALEPRSRAPHRVANKTPAQVEDEVVAERKRLVDAGFDAGPATIWHHLSAAGDGPAPSEATIWRILTRRGFITPEPAKAPKHTGRSFAAERVNQRWQIDDTGWALADGTEVRIIDIIDDCSRLAIRSLAVASCTGEAALEAMTQGAQRWGWPERFLSDNAKAFRFRLAEAVAALGVAAGHSRPFHPQTCGKVERFHQTVKRFLAAQPAAETLAELQAQLDAFTDYYNHQRPHRALKRRTPAAVFAATPRSGPADRALDTPTEIRRLQVTPRGHLWFSNRYRITVGVAHAGQAATVIITGVHGHVFIAGTLIRALTLDPTRTSQPLYDRPGRRPQTEQQLP